MVTWPITLWSLPSLCPLKITTKNTFCDQCKSKQRWLVCQLSRQGRFKGWSFSVLFWKEFLYLNRHSLLEIVILDCSLFFCHLTWTWLDTTDCLKSCAVDITIMTQKCRFFNHNVVWCSTVVRTNGLNMGNIFTFGTHRQTGDPQINNIYMKAVTLSCQKVLTIVNALIPGALPLVHFDKKIHI